MGNSFSGGDATWPTRRVATRQFVEMPEKEATIATATFGAGCYWGTEKWYAKEAVKDWDAPEGAVLATSVGFMCGRPEGCKRDPTYREVCSGSTGHVEVCQVKYEPRKTSYERLAKHFFTFHDPTTKNRQGSDAGAQYASVIFAHDPEQRATAERVREEVRRRVRDGRVRSYANPDVVTEVVDAADYYPASDAHQRYAREETRRLLQPQKKVRLGRLRRGKCFGRRHRRLGSSLGCARTTFSRDAFDRLYFKYKVPPSPLFESCGVQSKAS